MRTIIQGIRTYRREVIIVLVTTTVILATLLMAFQVYRVAVAEVTERHKLLAIDLAREAAIGLEGAVDFLARDLRLMAALQGHQLRGPDVGGGTLQMHARALLTQARDLGLSGISILDANRQVIFTSAPEEVARFRGDATLWARLRDPLEGQGVRAGAVFRVSDGSQKPYALRFILAIPLVATTSADPPRVYEGAVGLHVDLSALLRRFIQPIGTRPGIEAWVMAADGTLIYHPSHPEMMFRRPAEGGEESCRQCHDSFAPQKAMAASESWTGTYRAGDRGLRVAAAHRAGLADAVWTVVVSSPMSEVRILAGHRFWLFFVLVGISVAAPAVAAAMLLRLGRLRARAEAEAQQLEELRRLEQELNQASRLASIGEMVDSVAHEVNNPAAVALSRCEYVLEELDDGISKTELREDLTTVKQQIERIVAITQQLLRFSRRFPYQPRAVAVRDVVRNALGLLEPRLRSQPVQVVTEIPTDVPPVWGDSQQLEQVVINLLQNASDAVDAEGVIRVAARMRQRDGVPFVVLSVEDNGRGIANDHLNRIFEPFYTTKPPGKGTGLGLAIAQRIVKRHGGRLEVDSRPGKGSRFHVWLPTRARSEGGV